MPIQITCKKPGFRRAGMAHPARAMYPDGHFTPEQMRALQAEPMLVVTEVPATENLAKVGKGKK